MATAVRVTLGHLALIALAVASQWYDSELLSMGHTVHMLTPYVIVFLVGVWSAVSVKEGAFLGIAVGMLAWIVFLVVLLSMMVSHDAAADSDARSEGGEFYVMLAIILFLFLTTIGYGVGRLIQLIARLTLTHSSSLPSAVAEGEPHN